MQVNNTIAFLNDGSDPNKNGNRSPRKESPNKKLKEEVKEAEIKVQKAA
jgi:hypothetical protein